MQEPEIPTLAAKPSKQQIKKMRKTLNKAVNDSYQLSKEILDEIENNQDKYHWQVYAKHDCKVCYGRGTNEISHPQHPVNRVVPCDCALVNRKKQETYESKPLFGVDNGTKKLYYQKTKNDKFLVPVGWENAERVMV